MIEVLVATIILIIAAIAMPRLLRDRMVANEASAVASLRTIATVKISYQTTYQQGFAPSLAALGSPAGDGPASASAAA